MRIDGFVGIHQFGAAFIDQALDVGDPHVFAPDAQFDEQARAGQRRSARAADHQLHVLQPLAHHFQPVHHGSAHYDGGAVLVVVKNGNLHAFAQLALHMKAVGRLDVFQVDAAKRRLQRGDDVHQPVGVVLVDFNVEHVDARELLEQNGLAFHDRFARQRADVAQPQHGRAVGDHAHQIAARRVFGRQGWIGLNVQARIGHARRIRQRQIMLVGQRLGGHHGHFAARGLAVVVAGGVAQGGLGGSEVLHGQSAFRFAGIREAF